MRGAMPEFLGRVNSVPLSPARPEPPERSSRQQRVDQSIDDFFDDIAPGLAFPDAIAEVGQAVGKKRPCTSIPSAEFFFVVAARQAMSRFLTRLRCSRTSRTNNLCLKSSRKGEPQAGLSIPWHRQVCTNRVTRCLLQ